MITPETLGGAAEEAKTGSVPHVSNLLEQAANTIDALTAENARLREALEQVASHPNLSPLMVGFTNTITAKDLKQSLEDVREIARAALKGEPK